MPQLFLDPNNIGQPTPTKSVPFQLPRKVWAFGYIPDFDLWRPGDLLLFSAVKPTLGQNIVIKTQERLGYAGENAKWHHAAVYIGDHYMCEARPFGIRYHLVVDNVPAFRIRVRRDCQLSMDERFRVAIRALMRLTRRYSFISASTAWLRSWYNDGYTLIAPGTQRHGNAAICSQLFHEAYMEVTSRILVQNTSQIVLPADLSACQNLSDVRCTWSKLK